MRTRAAGDDGPRRYPDLLAAFLEHRRALRRSRSSLARAERILPWLFGHLAERGIADVRAVSEEDLVSFARQLEERALAIASRAAYLYDVRSFFGFLLRLGVILGDPSQGLPIPYAAALPRRGLTERQVERLLAMPPNSPLGLRDRALLEVLYGAGLRCGECVRLDVTDVDLAQKLVFVRNGKGQSDRVVPLAHRAVLAVDRYLREGRPELARNPRQSALFLAKSGRRLLRGAVNARMEMHARIAGLAGSVFPHALRHSYATHLLRHGASIRHVQELLGHQSIQTTALYTRVQLEDLRRMLSRAHPRERGRTRRKRK